jgi:hypothetical protein
VSVVSEDDKNIIRIVQTFFVKIYVSLSGSYTAYSCLAINILYAVLFGKIVFTNYRNIIT